MIEPELRRSYYHGCQSGYLDQVKRCIEEGVDINGLYCGCSPFIEACGHNHRQIVEYLIEKNVDVACPNQHDLTALMSVSIRGCKKIAKLLLIHDSSTHFIHHKDDIGRTALMCASKHGHEDIVRLLLRYDPSEEHISIKNDEGETAVDLAETDKIRELLRSPPIVNTKRAKPSTG